MQITNTKNRIMKHLIITMAVLFSAPYFAQAQFGDLLTKGKEAMSKLDKGDQTSSALKEALNFGVDEAVQSLSADNGYLESPYKILIPQDAQKVISKVKMVPGFQDVESKLTAKMNEAAELAAKKATPIFIDAIKGMSINDAVSILMGNNNAATNYLEKSTRKGLYSAFLPVIKNSLEEVNALSYWKTVVNAYNGIPLVKKMNPELDDHVNQKALDGMFSLIEKKEQGIRGDKSQRTTDLLKDVFSKQDKK